MEEFTGMPVNVTCSADGFPVPVIMWTFQDMPYTDGTVNSTMSTSTFTESTIVIDNLMLSDGGDYQCIIDSDAIMVLRNSNATVAVIDGMCVYSYMLIHIIRGGGSSYTLVIQKYFYIAWITMNIWKATAIGAYLYIFRGFRVHRPYCVKHNHMQSMLILLVWRQAPQENF